MMSCTRTALTYGRGALVRARLLKVHSLAAKAEGRLRRNCQHDHARPSRLQARYRPRRLYTLERAAPARATENMGRGLQYDLYHVLLRCIDPETISTMDAIVCLFVCLFAPRPTQHTDERAGRHLIQAHTKLCDYHVPRDGQPARTARWTGCPYPSASASAAAGGTSRTAGAVPRSLCHSVQRAARVL